MNLNFVNASDFTSKVVLNETDKAYIDIHDNLTFLEDSSFIWTSEKDGFKHLYLYDFDGKLINQITKGNWDVEEVQQLDSKKGIIYYC